MLLIIPFALSVLLVLVSSYMLASVFEPKKYGIGFLYTVLIAFAQVVLSFEVLSLLKQINVPGVIFANIAVFFAILTFWDKKGKPLYKPQIKETALRIFKALKRDKILMIMGFAFVFLICLIVFMNIIMPVNSFDALCYHLNRAAFWASQGHLNHFDIADDRNLVMPINSEILYTWVLVFLKNDWGLGLFSFVGYVVSIFSLYNILAFFGFCERKKLWCVFIVSSLASVISEASSTETDIIIAGLCLASILFYLVALRDKKVSLIAFSALAYALAIGTKTPSLIAFPGYFALIAYFSARNMKKEFYKPLLAFLIFLFVGFMLFASYNYICNFINYGNFMSTESSVTLHKFWGGPKAFVANYIRYIFMLFDFSGFRYSEYVGEYIVNAKLFLFDILRIPHNLGVTMSDHNQINNGLMDVKMGAGILGFLLFLPGLVASIVLGFIKSKSKKVMDILPFGIMFLINVFFLSGTLCFMVFSVRFITYFIVISSPVLVYSYFKKNPPIKLLVLFFVLSYMLLISTHLAARSFKLTMQTVRNYSSLIEAREVLRCSIYQGYVGQISFCHLRDKIRSYPKGSKIAILPSSDDRIYPVKMLYTEGYQVDTLLTELIDDYDISKYDYLIKTNPVQVSSSIRAPERAQTDYILKGKNFTFIPNHAAKCIYLGPDRLPVSKENVQPVTYNLCRVYDDYLEKHGFHLVQIIEYQSMLRENTNTMYFYKNVKKSN